MALYGPVVLCAADPDGEGETQPPDELSVNAMLGLAEAWQRVVADAARKGQDVMVQANADTVPGPVVYALPDDWNFGDPLPDVPL